METQPQAQPAQNLDKKIELDNIEKRKKVEESLKRMVESIKDLKEHLNKGCYR
jgi:hypothetical protein